MIRCAVERVLTKKTNENLLLCRIREEMYKAALEMENCIPMKFTGKSIKGYVFIPEQEFNTTKYGLLAAALSGL